MRQHIKQTLALCLIASLLFPANLFAGEGITPDANAPAGKRPSMDFAPNGVPVVNIAPPKSGLSHNQYTDFNVQKQGAILNNDLKAGQSQLGGVIAGNPNLKNGAASTILNEVTSSNRSHIQGYIEVRGKKADVILANPNGVTVNGGGFINANRGTITTGKPNVNESGVLQSFDVRQGDVLIEGAGVNASNLSGFDIVTRAAEINAEIYANDLNVVTGQNSYNPATRTATPLASDGTTKPAVAIDSTALGGMYAGRITLTSTEKGVGVNLDGVIQSTGDMTISADGKLVLKAAKAGGDMLATSANGDVHIKQAAKAEKTFSASGKNVTVSGSGVSASTNVRLKAEDTVALTADTKVIAGGQAAVSGKNIRLDNGAILNANETLAVQAKNNLSLGNRVKLASGQGLSVNGRSIQAGSQASVATNGNLTVQAHDSLMLDREAILSAAGDMLVRTGLFTLGDQAIAVSGGSLYAIASGDMHLGEDAIVQSAAGLHITAGNLALASRAALNGGSETGVHVQGDITAMNDVAILARNNLDLKASNISFGKNGVLNAGGHLNVDAGKDVNLGDGFKGVSTASLLIRARTAELGQKSSLASNGFLGLTLSEDLSLRDEGTLTSGDSVAITARTMTLGSNAIAAAAGNLNAAITENSTLGEGSLLLAQQYLKLFSGSIFLGEDAAIKALNGLQAKVTNAVTLAERSGMLSHGDISLTGSDILLDRAAFLNAGGMLEANASGAITLGDASKTVARKDIRFTGASIAQGNAAAVAADGRVSLTATNGLSLGKEAMLSSGEAMTLTSGEIQLGKKALVASGRALDVTVSGQIAQGADSRMLGKKDVQLTASALNMNDNAALAAGDNLTVKTRNQLVLGDGALLSSGATTALDTETLHTGKSTIEGARLIVKAREAVMDGGSFNALHDISLIATDLRAAFSSFLSGGGFDMQTTDAALADTSVSADTVNIRGSSVTLENSNVVAKGDISVNTDTLTLAGDAVTTLENIDLAALKGVLFAGGDFALHSGSITQTGSLVGSDAGMTVQGGTFNTSGTGALYAGKNLGVNLSGAAGLNGLKLRANGNFDLTAGSLSLENSSLAAQGALNASLDTLSVGSGSFFGSYLALNVVSHNLINEGLIFSGGDAAFRIADTLTNRSGADIYAMGDLELTGATADARMTRLFNDGANIESVGNLLLRADTFDNIGGSLQVQQVKASQSYLHIGMSDSLQGYNADGSFNLVNKHNAADYRTDDHALGKVKRYTREQEVLLGIPAGGKDHLQEWKTVYREEPVGDAAGAGLLAGVDMFIDAETINNTLSTISAGRDMTINAGTLLNKGIDLYERLDVFRWFFAMGKGNKWEGGFTQDWSSSKIYKSIPAVITAARNLSVTVAKGYDNSGREHADYVGAFGGSPAYNGLTITGVGLNNPAAIKSGALHSEASNLRGNALVGAGQGGESDLDQAARAGEATMTQTAEQGRETSAHGSNKLSSSMNGFMPPVKLGGMFTLSANSNHKYLIETNPALTSMATFYGSEYFLSRMGYNLQNEQRKLMGDAYFETRMVREQLLAQAGQRFLFDGVTDDAETMRRLMDNAAAEGRGLGLAVGVALTPDQINNLTKDIVWLEEVEYNGQTVLAPRLYLCDATRAELTVRGGTMTAQNVSLDGKGIVNSGLIRGNKVSLTSVDDIINRGGQITGTDTLFVGSDGSILNESGTLSGGNIGLLAGKDIRIDTLAETRTDGKLTHTTFQQVAVINATGGLTMQAGNNIVFSGGNVSTGGTTVLKAGNDVLLATVNAQEGYTSKNNRNHLSGNLASALVAENIGVNAKRDITVSGSSLSSRNDASLQAGGDITVAAVSNERSSYSHVSRGSSYSSTKQSAVSKAQEAIIAAGNNLSLQAGLDDTLGKGNVSVIGSVLAAGTKTESEPEAATLAPGGNLNISATGNVNIASAEEQGYSYASKKSKKVLSSSSEKQEGGYITSKGSILSGDNVNIAAGDNINVVGSTISASQDVNLLATRGDVIMTEAAKSSWSKKEKKKSGFGLFSDSGSVDIYRSEKTKGKESVTSGSGSTIMAGNNVNIAAGRDITAINTKVLAGNDLDMLAVRDVNLMPGVTESKSETSTKKSGFGLTSILKKEHGIPTMGSVSLGYHSREEGEKVSSTTNNGTFLSSGGNTSITAGSDINSMAVQMQSGKSIDLLAGNNINLLSAYDTKRVESFVKEVNVGVGMQVGQNVSSPAISSVTSLRDSVVANNKNKNHAAKPFDAPENLAYGRIGLQASYDKQTTVITESIPVGASLTAVEGISATAKNDLTMVGAKVDAKGDLTLQAGNNVNILAAQKVTTENTKKSHAEGMLALASGAVSSLAGPTTGSGSYISMNKSKNGVTTVENVHSVLNGANVTIRAGKDLSVVGSQIEAQKDMALTAGNNIRIEAGRMEKTETSSSSGFGFDLLNKTANLNIAKSKSELLVDTGSRLLSRGDMTLQAGQDLNVSGSGLVSEHDMKLAAARDLSLTPGDFILKERSSSFGINHGQSATVTEEEAKLFNGTSLNYTNRSLNASNPYGSDLHANGNLELSAGRDMLLQGSVVKGGDSVTAMAGRDLQLEVREAKHRSAETIVEMSAGVTAKGSQNVTSGLRAIVDNTLYNTKPDKETPNDHTPKLLVDLKEIKQDSLWKTGKNGYDAVRDVIAVGKKVKDLSNPKVTYSIKATSGASISNAKESQTVQTGTEIASNGDINLHAGRDMGMRGGKVSAMNDVQLDVGRNLDITASKRTMESTTASLGTSGSFGFGGKVSAREGNSLFGLEASGSGEFSHGSTKEESYDNAIVEASNKLTVKTGQDATIKGANLQADTVKMNVGGDLKLASLQDKMETNNIGVKGGATVNFGAGFALSGDETTERYITASGSRYKSDFVGEDKEGNSKQTSIVGKSGVDIRVEKNTDLHGSLIAAKNDNLKLDTGTLSWSDIHATSSGASISVGLTLEDEKKVAARQKDRQDKKDKHDEKMAEKLEGIPPADENWFTDVDDTVQGANNKLQQWNNWTQSQAARPKDMGVDVRYITQTVRATVGKGDITVRDNPGQSLSALNRDMDKAVTVTKHIDNRLHSKDPFNDLDGLANIGQKAADITNIIEHKGYERIKDERIASIKKASNKAVDDVEKKYNEITTAVKDFFGFGKKDDAAKTEKPQTQAVR